MDAVPHRMFCSPFIGGGNVEIHKAPVQVEVVGDLNGRVTNFMRVLRGNVRDLADAVELTPFSEEEYDLAASVADDPIEDARRFFVLCWGDINGGPTPTAFRFPSLSRWSSAAADINDKTALLYAAAKRIKHWHIYNKDYAWLINRITDKSYSTSVVVYLDPPFLKQTRSRKSKYQHEFTVDDHIAMLDLLRSKERDTNFFLSGYATDEKGNPNTLYDDALPNWVRYDKEMRTNSNGKRVESLWVSPLTAPHVNRSLDKWNSWQEGRGVVDNADYSQLFKV